MSEEETKREPRKYLGIYFECCNVYGRVYQNKDKTAYSGFCPRCMRRVNIKVGEDGTNQRFFKAY